MRSLDCAHHRARRPVRVAACLLAGFMGAAAPMLAQHAASAGPVTGPVIPDTAYPIPTTNVLFVSPSGNDASAGTPASPLRTLGQALQMASPNATIVMRAGTYRESEGSVSKAVTIQPYPHEQVWLKGSQVVTGFTPGKAAATWVLPGWVDPLKDPAVPAAAIDPAYPTAGLPEMVFFDGAPLVQVTSLSSLVSGTFYVDHSANGLYVGSDPAGHVVEVSVSPLAVEFDTSYAGSSAIRGIGFAQFAPSFNMSNPAMVVSASPNVTFENDVFLQSASRGLSILAKDNTVRASIFLNNGFTSLHADRADGLLVDGNTITGSNARNFSIADSPIAQAAGVKITHTQGATVTGNVVQDNKTNGVWFDLSTNNSVIADNLVRRNAVNGIFAELGYNILIASNGVANNGMLGLKVSGSGQVRIWNNTLSDNGTSQLGVYQDPRSNPNSGERARGITWTTEYVSLANNLLSSVSASTGPMVHTYDASKSGVEASTMISSNDDDAFAPVSSSGLPLATWVTAANPNGVNYSSLANLQAGTQREPSGSVIPRYTAYPLYVDASRGDFRLSPKSALTGTGTSLPADVAAVIGTSATAPVSPGALVLPGG